MIIIKILLATSLLIVFFQDTKERLVYWFMFPLIGLLCGLLFYNSTLPELFLNSILLNVIFVLVLILLISTYTKFKLNVPLTQTIGIGDILLFVALTLSFSTVSFIVIFISALIFSLLLHLFRGGKTKLKTTVPLAGYMSFFFLMSYLFHWANLTNLVYNI